MLLGFISVVGQNHNNHGGEVGLSCKTYKFEVNAGGKKN